MEHLNKISSIQLTMINQASELKIEKRLPGLGNRGIRDYYLMHKEFVGDDEKLLEIEVMLAVSRSVSLSHQEASISLLLLSIRGQTN